MNSTGLTRREFTTRLATTMIATGVAGSSVAQETRPFKLRYILASCMYGKTSLDEILAEVHKTGAQHIEIWALRHGNQREQIDEMGPDAFRKLLKKHRVTLGSFTCFKFGIFRMQPEMALVKKLGG